MYYTLIMQEIEPPQNLHHYMLNNRLGEESMIAFDVILEGLSFHEFFHYKVCFFILKYVLDLHAIRMLHRLQYYQLVLKHMRRPSRLVRIFH